MTYEYTIRVLPEVAANEQRLKAYLVREKGLDERTLNATRILKRSIDARRIPAYGLPQRGRTPAGHRRGCRSRRPLCRPAPHRAGPAPRGGGARQGRARAQERPGPDRPHTGRGPRVELQLRRRRRGSLLRRQALHPQQEARQCGQDTQRLLPARRFFSVAAKFISRHAWTLCSSRETR